MVNGIRTIYPGGLNKKAFDSKLCVGSRVRHENTFEPPKDASAEMLWI